MYLFADTETTGLRGDAMIAQFAMRMEDEQKRVVGEFSTMISPENWAMPEETAKFHGISQDLLEMYGMPIATVFALLNRWSKHCSILIFHNKKYDLGRLEHVSRATGTALMLPPTYCTMESSTNIVKCPPTEKMIAAGRHNFKAPNLQEAHKFFTGSEFDGAHDAMADVRACSVVYWGIQDHLKISGAAA